MNTRTLNTCANHYMDMSIIFYSVICHVHVYYQCRNLKVLRNKPDCVFQNIQQGKDEKLSCWDNSVIIKFQNIVQSPIFSLGVEFLDMKSHDEVIKYALKWYVMRVLEYLWRLYFNARQHASFSCLNRKSRLNLLIIFKISFKY